MADEPTSYSDAELNELISHVMALRKDFIQGLLAEAQLPRADRDQPKGTLREVLRQAIDDGRLSVERLVGFLDEKEPGGKQHVFVLRPVKAYNDQWTNTTEVRQRLSRRAGVRELLDARVPLVMPADLTLSSVRIGDGLVEVTGVEARRYFERDERYDSDATSEEGLPVELRAYVARVARSTVVLRWDLAQRHAALHVTQSTGRGLSRDHYSDVRARFTTAVAPWLDMGAFRDVNLHKVIHKLQLREQTPGSAWTRSRRGRWETDDGSEVEAISSSVDASLFEDRRVAAAVGQVSDADSGSSGNLYWLDGPDNPLDDSLHVTIIASDSRVHFMVPSSPQIVDHVLGQLRTLL